MKLQEYLDEANLEDTYLKICKKDLADIKTDLRKLETAMAKKDVVEVKSASRAIESSARRIKERLSII